MSCAPVLRRMLSLSMLALMPVCVGCASGTAELDAGASDIGSAQPEVELRFNNSEDLELTPREAVTVELFVVLGGSPVSGVTVRVAFEGDAHDASLGEVQVVSTASGRVRTTLRASSIPATFRLRATADSAVPAFLQVGVSATGFGSVRVNVDDLSATGVPRVRAEAYAAVDCDDPLVAEGRFGRAITLPEGTSTATFSGLPAGTHYAIVARGLSPFGDELAFGCVSSVSVLSDAEVAVTVRLGARVQFIAGEYDAAFGIEAAELEDVLQTGIDATVAQQLPGGDAAYLLDALSAHIASVGGADALNALAALQAARATGLDAVFAQYLVERGAGPSVALASALVFVASQFRLNLAGTLSIEADGDTAFMPSSLELFGPLGTYSGLPAGNGAQPNFGFVTRLDPVEATVTFDPVTISLALGDHLDAIFDSAVAASALSSFAALSDASSAATFSFPSLNTVCDERCRTTVFADAAIALGDAWFETLGRDLRQVILTFRGDAVASDDDGDFHADALSALLEGDAVLGGTTWPFAGTLSAARRPAPVPP